jgi:hypothetical protein
MVGLVPLAWPERKPWISGPWYVVIFALVPMAAASQKPQRNSSQLVGRSRVETGPEAILLGQWPKRRHACCIYPITSFDTSIGGIKGGFCHTRATEQSK